jgi:Tfp pilus assembly protein PilF
MIPGFLFYLIGWAGTFEGILSWEHQVSLAFGLFGLALWFGLVLSRNEDARISLPHRWVWIPLVLILLEKVARAVANQSWQATEDLAQSTSLALLFLIILNSPKSHAPILWGIAGSTALWSLMGMYWSHQGGYRELALPLGLRALMGGLLVTAFPFSLGLLYEKGNGRRRIWAFAIVVILAISIIQTRSAAALVILCVLLSVCVWTSLHGRTLVRAALVLLAVALLTLAQLTEFEPVNRLSALLSGRADPTLSMNQRLRYWEGAVAFFAENPVFGHGAGQVGTLYGPYRIQQAGLAPHGEVVADVHNLPLNWLVEFGLWGAGLRVFLFAVLIGVAVIAAKSPDGTYRRAAAGSLLAYGVFSLAHYQLSNPAILFILVALAGVAAPTSSFLKLKGWKESAVVAGLLCAACSILAFQIRVVSANYLHITGKALPGRAGVGRLVRASILDSRSGVYDLAAALRMEHLYWEQVGETSNSRLLFEAAEGHYVKTLNQQTFIPSVHAVYGSFLLRTRRACNAIVPLRKAVSLDFFYSYSHFDLANALLECGDQEMARRQAAVTLMTNPSFAFASVWRTRPEFLRAALTQASDWLARWSRFSDRRQVRLLSDFFASRLRNMGRTERISAQLTFSDPVATELSDDPFAFIFQRRMIPFIATEVLIDGVASGTWTPEGIGSLSFLNRVTYPRVLASYENGDLGELMCHVGACS